MLAGATPALARALAEHLETWFHRPYAAIPGGGPTSVLVRSDRAIAAARVESGGLDAVSVRVRDESGRESAILLAPGLGDGGRAASRPMREAGCSDLLAIGDDSPDRGRPNRRHGRPRDPILEAWAALGRGGPGSC